MTGNWIFVYGDGPDRENLVNQGAQEREADDSGSVWLHPGHHGSQYGRPRAGQVAVAGLPRSQRGGPICAGDRRPTVPKTVVS